MRENLSLKVESVKAHTNLVSLSKWSIDIERFLSFGSFLILNIPSVLTKKTSSSSALIETQKSQLFLYSLLPLG